CVKQGGLSSRSLPGPRINHPRSKRMRFWRRTGAQLVQRQPRNLTLGAEHSGTGEPRRHLLEELEAFARHLGEEQGCTGNVPIRPCEVADESGTDGIAGSGHHDWNARRGTPGRCGWRRPDPHDDVDALLHEFPGEGREALLAQVSEPRLQYDVLAIDPPEVVQCPAQRLRPSGYVDVSARGPEDQDADFGHALRFSGD